VGICKPDPAIFALLIERLSMPSEQVLFVDDREDNLAAARELGIRGHLFHSAAALREDLLRHGILPARPQS